MKNYTDPIKFCKDLHTYETALVFATCELMRLESEGYVSHKATDKLFEGLCKGLYGDE